MDRLTREEAEALFHSHLRLAAVVAGRYRHRHRDLDELHAAALVGLWEAACRFEPARGLKFETLAGERMKGAVLDRVRELAGGRGAVARRTRRMPAGVRRLAAPPEPALEEGTEEGFEFWPLIRGGLREAVRLQYFRRLPLAEVGRRLGMTEAAAAKAVSRAVAEARRAAARAG